MAKSDSSFRILEPSADALLDDGELHPCPTCGRKFVQKTFDRHIKICEKVPEIKLIEKRVIETNKLSFASQFY